LRRIQKFPWNYSVLYWSDSVNECLQDVGGQRERPRPTFVLYLPSSKAPCALAPLAAKMIDYYYLPD